MTLAFFWCHPRSDARG